VGRDNKIRFLYLISSLYGMSKSPARKLIDTSYILLKDDKYYITADLMSRIDSAVLFAVAYDLHEFFNFSKSKLQRYLKLRNLPNPKGVDIVDSKNSCFDLIESIVFVRALTPERWEKKKYNKVTINNLKPNDASREEKRKSLRNLKVKCQGDISNFASACRPSAYQRKLFGDERELKDVPGSFVDAYLCKHFFIGLDWLKIFQNVFDFDIGLSSHVTSVAEDVIKDVLRYNVSRYKMKLPNYKLNTFYRKLLFEMYAPLNELYWRS